METRSPATGTHTFWWLLALLCTVAFAFQGTRGIWEPDEGRYTATGINMLESGNYLVPTVDGEHPHLTKPPLTYWALAGSFALIGHNEWAARLPGALAFVGTGLLVFGLGRRFSPGQPWLPALVWALSLAPVIGANVVSTDCLLTLFETAAMLAFVEALAAPDARARRWVLAMWLAWGLAFMTKGPPALLPLLAMTVYLALHDRARLRRLFAPAGLAVFVLVAFTWFALILREDPDRLGYFLGYEVYDRIFTAKHGRHAEWYGGFETYLPVLLAGALPWWVLALIAADGVRGTWRRLRARFAERNADWLLLGYWFCVPLLVFFAAKSRLELYVLPLFVPLALMFARPLSRWSWLTRRRLALIAGLTACALLAVKGASAFARTDRDARVMAASIRGLVDLHGFDEIVFVDMRGFYGLQLYLDVNIESIQSQPGKVGNSDFVAVQDLCSELAERENNVYALKQSRIAQFLAAASACGGPTPAPIGAFDADDNRIILYRLQD